MEEELETNKCTCEDGYEEHTCPYAEEINNDTSLCICCSFCEQNCCNNI